MRYKYYALNVNDNHIPTHRQWWSLVYVIYLYYMYVSPKYSRLLFISICTSLYKVILNILTISYTVITTLTNFGLVITISSLYM